MLDGLEFLDSKVEGADFSSMDVDIRLAVKRGGDGAISNGG